MNVAIVGSRDWPYINEIRNAVASLEQTDVVVSGGARGVDTIAENLAKRRGLDTLIFHAEWDKLGKRAGFVRNCHIVEASDRVVAFQLENSRGTQHTIDRAVKRGIPVKVISYTKAHGMQVTAL